MKDPFQFNKDALRSHQLQGPVLSSARERPAERDRRQTVGEGQKTDSGVSVSRAPGITLHQLNSGDLCSHCPCTTHSELGELWTQRVTEERGDTLSLSPWDGLFGSLSRWLTALLQVAVWMSQKYEDTQRRLHLHQMLSSPHAWISTQRGPQTAPHGGHPSHLLSDRHT